MLANLYAIIDLTYLSVKSKEFWSRCCGNIIDVDLRVDWDREVGYQRTATFS